MYNCKYYLHEKLLPQKFYIMWFVWLVYGMLLDRYGVSL